MNPIHLLLVLLPIALCLKFEIEDASNLRFRHIGNIAGTVGRAHILMTVNITQHLALMKQLCTLPPNVHRVELLLLEQANLIETLESHCRTLLGALIEREAVWFNRFNSQRNRMARSIMDNKECTNPHPLAMQSSAFWVKQRAVVGAFLILGLVAAASSIYSAMQLAALSAAQDVNVQIWQEHEMQLSVNERSIALNNSTVLRMGKKVAKLSDSLGNDELILQLGFTLDSVFEDSTRILRGLNALADHRLSHDFVKTSKMTEVLLLLENSMQQEGYELGQETMDDIFRCETSHLVWDNGTLNIYSHIPAYKIDSRLQLLEHIPVPLILPEFVQQYPMGKGYRNTAMFVQPLHTILAIQTGGWHLRYLPRRS
jgi:hypothetical protein